MGKLRGKWRGNGEIDEEMEKIRREMKGIRGKLEKMKEIEGKTEEI